MPFDGRVPLELTETDSVVNFLDSIARRIEAGDWTHGTLHDHHGHCLLGHLFEGDAPPEVRERAVQALHDALPARARYGTGPYTYSLALQDYNDFALWPVLPRLRSRGILLLVRRAAARLRAGR